VPKIEQPRAPRARQGWMLGCTRLKSVACAYYRIGDALRKSITIHEVASLAGVSTATVTRVLRGDAQVTGETRERVQRILNSTGYHVNAIAQSLRTKRVATVAHILSSLLPNPFYANVARGLQREATKYGYEVLVYNAEESPKLELEAVQAALRRRSDAIIFTTPIKAENVALATGAGVRVVQVERPTEAPSAVVTVDNYQGAWEATEYLISLGHRAITYIGRRFSSDARAAGSVEAARLEGYLDAMQKGETRSEVVLGEYYISGHPEFQALGRGYAESILAGALLPTAIFAASDILAAGVLQALYAAEIRVPQEISVVGFDDTYARALTPSLSTVAVPMDEVGRMAFRCAIVEPLEDDVRLGTHLIVRESTGRPLPAEDLPSHWARSAARIQGAD
jgi:DNA-binding LacI/PurR family transcriptional regulator